MATGVNNLDVVLRELDDLQRARQACERALALLEKFMLADHPNIKIVRGNLELLE